MNRLISIVIGAFIVVWLLSSTIFTVDQRQFAIVFALGEVKQVIRDPGLHFKLPPPFQNVIYLDKRILTIDTGDADRFITAEKKNILVDTFVKWRIADPRLYFVSLGGDEQRAQDRMSQIVKAALNEEITKRTVREVISGERGKVMTALQVKVEAEAKQIGLEIVDIRLKRVDYVEQINNSVYDRMKSERVRVANELRSIGAAESEKLIATRKRSAARVMPRLPRFTRRRSARIQSSTSFIAVLKRIARVSRIATMSWWSTRTPNSSSISRTAEATFPARRNKPE